MSNKILTPDLFMELLVDRNAEPWPNSQTVYNRYATLHAEYERLLRVKDEAIEYLEQNECINVNVRSHCNFCKALNALRAYEQEEK